jgi:hypothetical protein
MTTDYDKTVQPVNEMTMGNVCASQLKQTPIGFTERAA